MLKQAFLLAALLFTGVAFAQQTKEDIQKKQADLQKEIADLNNTLAQIRKDSKTSVAKLAMVQRKIKAREQLVSNINKDLRLIDDNIYLTTLEMNRIRRELDTLKQNYAKSIVFAYKNRSNYNYLNFLFSASSFNEAMRRMAYLRTYRRFRQAQANSILKTQNELAAKAGFLKQSQGEKTSALQEQNSQLKVLEDDKKEQDQVVKELKSNEKEIAARIKNQEKNRSKLKQSLATIVRREKEEAERLERERIARQKAAEKQAAEEAKKRQQTAASSGTGKTNTPATGTSSTPANTAPATTGVKTARSENRSASVFENTEENLERSLNFESNRGRLPWPVNGIITGLFGTHQVPNTKITERNDGIILQTKPGATVTCVADGVVSYVAPMEDYYYVVVRHGKYLTVYNFLESTSVTSKQTVKAGTVLGKTITEDGEGKFEIQVVNDRSENLNPEIWLKRR